MTSFSRNYLCFILLQPTLCHIYIARQTKMHDETGACNEHNCERDKNIDDIRFKFTGED